MASGCGPPWALTRWRYCACRSGSGVGRAGGEGKDTYTDVDLALEDRRPFNLSRRHFSIEEEDGALIIRDFGSYHGTTVNGTTLGGEGRPRTAPLMTGESELITGKPDSPFRFRIVVD